MSRTTDWVIDEEEKNFIDRDGDGGYDAYLLELSEKRHKAEEHVKTAFNELQVSTHPHNTAEFHSAIWFASTTILPGLEVQVVIDSNDTCHVSTGSAGFVSFTKNPVGLKLPVKCWIHTHPFGSAYFSGVDWATVNAWEPLMKTAYVLGGRGHFGFWTQDKPYELAILNAGEVTIQYQNRGEEE